MVTAQDDYKLRLLEDHLTAPITLMPLPELSMGKPLRANMATLQISGGKKDKLRPGDIVGALTKDNALQASDIGRIKIASTFAFVAVNTALASQALELIANHKIKGRRFRAKRL